jgi:hypothetical protein
VTVLAQTKLKQLPVQHSLFSVQASPFGWPQATPPVPQKPLPDGWQVLPGTPGSGRQQPSGQLCASQTHRPALQPWPAGHAPQLPPQPSGPHALPAHSGVQHAWSWQTWPAPQVAQRAPFVPQDSALVPGRQTPSFPGPASQQPLGQLSTVQTHRPFWHTSPPWLQSTQNSPSLPHASRAVPGRHVPPLQQPSQFCGVQQGAAQKLFPVEQNEPDGAALTQTEPGANVWQSPSVVQLNPEASWVPLQKGSPARETRQTHSGPSSRSKQVALGAPGSAQKSWPWQVQLGEQVTHWPFWQISALLQGSQATPPAPQFWSEVPGRQAPLASQQPFGQLSGPHATHWPLWQTSSSSHSLHSAPPVPQNWLVVPAWQLPGWPGLLVQQPFGQLCRVQRHSPSSSSQTCPAAHVPQLPPQPSGPHSRPPQSGSQVQC